MFKKENRIWWYIVGLIVIFIIFGFFVTRFLYPFIVNLRLPFWNEPFTYQAPASQNLDINSDYQANFYTSEGIIIARLYPKLAPQNVNNFVFLAREEFYEETEFHRVFADFLIQGGDRNTLNDDSGDDGRGGPGYTVVDEVNWDAANLPQWRRDELTGQGYTSTPGLESLPLKRNVLAMANSGPNTNGSQFFFVIADDNDPRLQKLNGRFTVIGEIVSGADVVRKIANAKVNNDNPNLPRPIKPVVLNKVEIVRR